MGMPRSGAKRWTAAMVRAFPEDGNRYEVVEGELLVTPAPRAMHQRAVREMAFALHEWVKGQDIGEVLMSPADIELEPRGLVQPDIFVAPVVRKWADVRSLALGSKCCRRPRSNTIARRNGVSSAASAFPSTGSSIATGAVSSAGVRETRHRKP